MRNTKDLLTCPVLIALSRIQCFCFFQSITINNVILLLFTINNKLPDVIGMKTWSNLTRLQWCKVFSTAVIPPLPQAWELQKLWAWGCVCACVCVRVVCARACVCLFVCPPRNLCSCTTGQTLHLPFILFPTTYNKRLFRNPIPSYYYYYYYL